MTFSACGGDPGGARTLDPLIKSQLLYQLSHGVNLRFISELRLQSYSFFIFPTNFSRKIFYLPTFLSPILTLYLYFTMIFSTFVPLRQM